MLDLKCAVSGAGRSLKENLLHAELSEGYHAYAIGGTHRHLGEFDQEFSADKDDSDEQHGIKVVVDKKSSLYLDGTTLDYYDGLDKRGFHFENPNATKTCGCGSSFQA
ncbi:MAG: iron-sulfur cluster assembly accessory protein [Pirellulaceae bacterium]